MAYDNKNTNPQNNRVSRYDLERSLKKMTMNERVEMQRKFKLPDPYGSVDKVVGKEIEQLKTMDYDRSGYIEPHEVNRAYSPQNPNSPQWKQKAELKNKMEGGITYKENKEIDVNKKLEEDVRKRTGF